MTETNLLILAVLWIVCAVGSYLIASQRKDPSPGMWGVVGFLLGPLGLLATGIMAKGPKPEMLGRICVHCGKVVAPDRERLCNNCGEPFSG